MFSDGAKRISVLPEGCAVTCMSGTAEASNRESECEELRVEHLPQSDFRQVASDSDSDEDASDSALTAALSTLFCAGAYGRRAENEAVPVMTYDEVMQKMCVAPASVCQTPRGARAVPPSRPWARDALFPSVVPSFLRSSLPLSLIHI